MVGVPVTKARLSHALTIRARGQTIGAIHSWGPAQSREVDSVWEVNPLGHGMPVDQVPQTLNRREMRVARYDLYASVFEEVFGIELLGGGGSWLIDQTEPLEVRENWVTPGQSVLGAFQGGFNAVNSLTNTFGPVSSGVAKAGAKVAGANAASLAAIQAAVNTPVIGAAVAGALDERSQGSRVYIYGGCYFTDLGRQIDAKGDRVISVEATLTWLTCNRVI